ncbi:MAG: transcriptional repressor NrdR [Candidatus Omnitrophota bacterium]|nr:MAG: transcriptional repressor NrdR [Candidatus Omnitrophota bacterium]
MKCPYCSHPEDKVVDSRSSRENDSIRRRRECLRCQRRFTTYEHIEEIPLMVIKKNGQRQPFDRNKITAGLLKACEKRPISAQRIESILDTVEKSLLRRHNKEVTSWQIGELIMKKLHSVDQVAYVRFASVYREFKDVGEFMKELKDIVKKERK